MIDVILSIPILSYIFFPTSGASTSTTVNLVFFYMTWSSLVFSHHPLEIHLSGLVVVRVLFWLVPSLLSLVFDVGLPSLAVGWKHGGSSALPPRDFRRLGKSLGLALANVLLLLATEAAVGMAYTTLSKRHVFKMSTTLPMPWIMFKHCVFIFTSREVLHYYVHRYVLHGSSSSSSSSSTAYVARKHAAYAHDIKSGAPHSLQVYTDHITALLLQRFLPVFLPSALIRTHMLTYFFVEIVVTVEETFALSGYTFVPGILLSGIAQRTAIHYAGRGSSNFGPLGILDWVHGTSRGRDILDDVRNEADKHNLQDRSARKADQTSNVVKDGLESLKQRVKSG